VADLIYSGGRTLPCILEVNQILALDAVVLGLVWSMLNLRLQVTV
jgi:hypothetical protein